MFQLYWEISGKRVSTNNFANALEAAVFKSVQQKVYAAVGLVRCSVHGQGAHVTAKGSDMKHLRFDIRGCFPQLIEQVKRRLSA